MPKIKNVKYRIVSEGTGEEFVTERNACRVTLLFFLNKGEFIDKTVNYDVAYADRTTIAGIRYGVLGMRRGEIRELIVPPHLAYGAAGSLDVIPANAVLKINVELHEIY